MTKTTPKPLAVPLQMSTAPSKPTPTPLPVRSRSISSPGEQGKKKDSQAAQNGTQGESRKGSFDHLTRPHPKPTYPSPKLRFECRDLNHPGATTFFSNNQPPSDLSSAVLTVLKTLYTSTKSNSHIPPTRSITLILRPMGGVAYTTGSDLDSDHKEIHFSLDYIHGITSRTPGREAHEIQGVLVHEMVHAWQWNGLGTAPGGLIEGIADFVRLKAGLSPSHWKRAAGDRWDQGYQHTAYFLEWVEEECGEGSVRKINDKLKDQRYEEDEFWDKLFGRGVKALWEDYKKSLVEREKKERREEHTMGEDAFWSWVKGKRSGEDTIVLKAVWRTRRHRQRENNVTQDEVDEDLEQLWHEYTGTFDTREIGRKESLAEGTNIESEDDDAVLVEQDNGAKIADMQ